MPASPTAPPRRRLLGRYGLALLCTLLAAAFRTALDPVLGDQFPFVAFFAAVLFTAWAAGFGPALTCAGLGAAAAPAAQAGLHQGSRRRGAAERRAAERLLARFALLVRHTRDIVLFIRLDGRIVDANDAAVVAYGYDRADLLTKNILDLRA